MSGTIAYLNGRFLPAEQLLISPTDAGFVLGVTLAEQLRTFAGRLFALEAHLERLQRGLEIVGWSDQVAVTEMREAAERIAAHNFQQLAPSDDLGLTIFVTPGVYSIYADDGASGPTIGIHTFRLPFRLWVDKYHQGQHLVIPQVRQITASQWPAELKCRSRMHYYLAEEEVHRSDPHARPLLLSQDGWVTETPTANVVAYQRDEGLIAPPRDLVLPGVSLQFGERLAERLGIPFTYRPLLPDELWAMEELLMTSTSYCLLPVVRLDARPIGRGRPGEVFRRLLQAWNQEIGLDIAEQAAEQARQG